MLLHHFIGVTFISPAAVHEDRGSQHIASERKAWRLSRPSRRPDFNPPLQEAPPLPHSYEEIKELQRSPNSDLLCSLYCKERPDSPVLQIRLYMTILPGYDQRIKGKEGLGMDINLKAPFPSSTHPHLTRILWSIQQNLAEVFQRFHMNF